MYVGVHADKKIEKNLARSMFFKICSFLCGFYSVRCVPNLQTPPPPPPPPLNCIRDLQVTRMEGLLKLLLVCQRQVAPIVQLQERLPSVLAVAKVILKQQ
jgi:hypothetical protein